ncbi:hypothetical protein H6P81_005914 [Aristolochia fimbriata]|uniref:glycerol-3-phosphate 1-O-acyltransferase n=1 Tax=Aristolochia fimbriata TaxID=158543 RepID=A0AAV7EXZ8_ARIFI|nr:hypothetical protein H6P81_005914 [Aristolochia fimbriata]
MWILSASPSISGVCLDFRAKHQGACSGRFSTGPCSFSASAGVRRGTRLVRGSDSKSKFRAMAELVQDKEATERTVAPRRGAVLASDLKGNDEVEHSTTFLDVRSEEELLSGIRKEIETGRLPPSVASGMEEVYQNYRNAILQSGHPEARELILSNMAITFDRILMDVEDPFVFSPHHKAIREPFDYYMFGQKYIRPLLDFRKSYVGNIELFNEIEEKLQQGHNIIIISNHQTEADPAVISLLLETTHPNITEKMTFVAGDRVLTDPVCKPFSMGRNLICVYSKKHMYDIPELVEMKKRANTRSLKEMALLLRSGSQIIWIAPSGGRDRADPITGGWFPAPFDASAVDNLRRLSYHSGVPGHMYPLALLCYDVMPPPPQVEKEIGEQRLISYHGVGLSVGQETSFDDVTIGINPEEAKAAFSEALYSSVMNQYSVLKSAVHGDKGLAASNSSGWFKEATIGHEPTNPQAYPHLFRWEGKNFDRRGSVGKVWWRRGYQPETLAEEELLVAPHQSNAWCSHEESEHLKERISNLEAELANFRSTVDDRRDFDREDHSWGNSGGIGVLEDVRVDVEKKSHEGRETSVVDEKTNNEREKVTGEDEGNNSPGLSSIVRGVKEQRRKRQDGP